MALLIGVSSAHADQGDFEVNHEIPLSRSESSETLGVNSEGQLSWNFQISPVHTDLVYKLVDYYSTQLVGTGREDVYRDRSVAGALELGIADHLDLSWRATRNTPFFAQIKFQVLGDSQIYSDAGNFSLSVFAGAGRYTGRSGNHLWFSSLWGEERWNRRTYDLGISAGFRPDSRLLVYVTANRSFLRLDGEQRLDSAVTSWVPYHRSGDLTGFHLGPSLASPAFWSG